MEARSRSIAQRKKGDVAENRDRHNRAMPQSSQGNREARSCPSDTVHSSIHSFIHRCIHPSTSTPFVVLHSSVYPPLIRHKMTNKNNNPLFEVEFLLVDYELMKHCRILCLTNQMGGFTFFVDILRT